MSYTPLSVVLAALESRGFRPAKSGPNLSARCPAHEDSRASLSVSEGEDGRALLKCHAGCETEAVVEALGLTMKDLFPEETKPARKPRRESPGHNIVAAYPYTDETGVLLFEVVRMKPKDFRQRKPDPTKPGAFLWALGDVRKPLYRLPEVLAAAKAGGRVYVVEGEKDADTLASLGLCATTNPSGAGKWLPEHSEALRSAHVIVLPDADEPGRKHGQAVAKSVHGIAASVRILTLGRPGVKDASDFVTAGGTREDLDALADESPAWTQVSAPPLATLLDILTRHIRRYVVLSPEQASLCALWVVHTYVIEAFDVTPYLIVTSPERRCGKSRLLEVLRGLVANAWYVVRPSEAVLFRKLSLGCVLFLDEVDTIFSTAAKDSTEGVRATLNAGFERGAVIPRCKDHGEDLVDFEVFGPKVLAGIGDPPDTVKDRGFVLALRRARRSETRERFRRRKAGPVAEEIRRQIEAWSGVGANVAALRRAEPSLPDALNDRAQDAAEPLLALADLASGEWPERARTALVALAGEAAEDEVEDTSGVALLRDLVNVFERLAGPKHATTDALLRELNANGSLWEKWDRGEGLDALGLARFLKRYRVRSRNVKTADDKVLKGYRRADILDAAERYVTAIPKGPEENAETVPVGGGATPATPLQPAQEAVRIGSGSPATSPATGERPFHLPRRAHGSGSGSVTDQVAAGTPAREAPCSAVAEVAATAPLDGRRRVAL